MESLTFRVAARKVASFFEVGDVVLYGKYKNHRGKIVRMFLDEKGNPAIEVEPIPKGRKKNKVMGLFKIWHLPERRLNQNPTPTVSANTMDPLTPRVVRAFRNKTSAVIGVGDTWENEHYRIHRFRDVIRVWELTNAGKRGKKVQSLALMGSDSKHPMESWALEFQMMARRGANWDRMRQVAEEAVEIGQGPGFHRVEVSYSQERGVDVTPGGFKTLKIDGKKVYIEVDHRDFTVRDKEDQNNLPTCTPAVKGGLKAIPVFYRWVQENEAKIQNMSFRQVEAEMDKLGIPYHFYCAID